MIADNISIEMVRNTFFRCPSIQYFSLNLCQPQMACVLSIVIQQSILLNLLIRFHTVYCQNLEQGLNKIFNDVKITLYLPLLIKRQILGLIAIALAVNATIVRSS